MKRILFFIAILLITPLCMAKEGDFSSENNTKEIQLDTGYKYKEYNLKKPDLRNKTDLYNNNDDDDYNPAVEFMSAPLQLLKQYQNEKY